MDGVKELILPVKDCLEPWAFMNGLDLKVAVAHGLAHAKTLMQAVRGGDSPYHFIEIMACPGGCLGGGGQPIPTNPDIRLKRVQALYAEEMGLYLRKANENPEAIEAYEEFLLDPMGPVAKDLLHTHYTPRNTY